MRRMLICLAAAGLCIFFFAAPARAQTAPKPAPPAGVPEIVCVTDFELDAGDITRQERLIRRPRMQEDPRAQAGKLVELLATSLVSELKSRSVPVMRLYPGAGAPERGWLVKGQFMEVDEGNRLRRAMIGFGAGATDMQIEVAVVNLASGSKEPFLIFGTDSKTGKGPGAVVAMNPYVAAAKFVMSKRASEKDVRKTARQIADVLVKSMQQGRS